MDQQNCERCGFDDCGVASGEWNSCVDDLPVGGWGPRLDPRDEIGGSG